MAHDLLQHEPPHAGARVDRSQNEQRLEHDREVVPQRGERLAAQGRRQPCEDVGDPHRQGRSPPRAGDQRRLAHLRRQRLHVFRRDHEPRLRQDVRGARQRGRRRVHREVHAGVERARRDHRHHADERLHQHAAVADDPGVGLASDHLGRRAGRDQRVESGDRAARDRDEREWEQLAREHRPFARGRERRQGRHAERRQEDEDRHAEHDHGGDLQERREIIAGAEQHPHRQDRGDESVGDHHPRERRARVREGGRDRRVIRDPAAAH